MEFLQRHRTAPPPAGAGERQLGRAASIEPRGPAAAQGTLCAHHDAGSTTSPTHPKFAEAAGRERARSRGRQQPGQLAHVVEDDGPRTDQAIARKASGFLSGFVELDERGYVLTGPDLPRSGAPPARPRGWNLDRDPLLFETSVPGVFAAGDVRSGANRRVAAAVGEGSAAIYSVQRYLETV